MFPMRPKKQIKAFVINGKAWNSNRAHNQNCVWHNWKCFRPFLMWHILGRWWEQSYPVGLLEAIKKTRNHINLDLPRHLSMNIYLSFNFFPSMSWETLIKHQPPNYLTYWSHITMHSIRDLIKFQGESNLYLWNQQKEPKYIEKVCMRKKMVIKHRSSLKTIHFKLKLFMLAL